MSKFKKGDLALAKFRNYPLWPVRIVDVNTQSEKASKFLVFCYGSHDLQTVLEVNLVLYAEKSKEASHKTERSVNKAFQELEIFPDIYLQYLKKAPSAQTGSNSEKSSVAVLVEKLVSTEQELAQTKQNMLKDIGKLVTEKVAQKNSINPGTAEQIISQVYDGLSVEYNGKFDKIGKVLKGLRAQTESLENRIAKMEDRLDEYQQEAQLDSLVFVEVKQAPGVDLKVTMNNIIKDKMGLSALMSDQILSMQRFRLPNPTAQISDESRFAPVIVKFSNKDVAHTVFKAKSKLAKSGVFVNEYLTKQRKIILDSARDKFGAKNVWSDQGRIFARLPGEASSRRLRKVEDTF